MTATAKQSAAVLNREIISRLDVRGLCGDWPERQRQRAQR